MAPITRDTYYASRDLCPIMESTMRDSPTIMASYYGKRSLITWDSTYYYQKDREEKCPHPPSKKEQKRLPPYQPPPPIFSNFLYDKLHIPTENFHISVTELGVNP